MPISKYAVDEYRNRDVDNFDWMKCLTNAELDAEIARDVTDVLLETTRAWGAGLVICTHDEALYSRADVIWKVDGGKLYSSKNSPLKSS